MALGPGSTFILTRATRSTPHLWVVLWAPAGPAGAVLIVHLESLRAHSDRTAIIRPGEHPFIQHDTCVIYNDVRRTTAEKLSEALAQREAIPRADADAALLAKLRDGLFRSAHTPNAIRRIAVEEFGAADPVADQP